MGNYTQFHANIPLRKDTPDDIVLLIHHAIYDPGFGVYWNHILRTDSLHTITLPDHPFFKTERWEGIFMGPNFHHEHGAKFILTKSGYYDLEIHCDINYGVEEVCQFIDWITPYVAGRKRKQYIGWWQQDDLYRVRINEYINR